MNPNEWTLQQEGQSTFAGQMEAYGLRMARISEPNCLLIYLQAEELGGSQALLVPCLLVLEADSVVQLAYMDGRTYMRTLK